MWWRTSFTSNWATLVRALVRHQTTGIRVRRSLIPRSSADSEAGSASASGARSRTFDELAQAVGVFPGAEQGDHQVIGGAERLRMAGPEGIPALRQRALSSPMADALACLKFRFVSSPLRTSTLSD